MKILYFHQHFSTPEGFTGTRSYEMARHLIARGHDVTIVCGSGAMSHTGLHSSGGTKVADANLRAAGTGIQRGDVDGIHVIEICLPYSNYDGLLKRSFTFLRFATISTWLAWRERYDLLFATSTPLTAGIPGIVMRLLKPQHKFVFEVRDLWPELPKAMGVIKNPLVLWAMSLLEKTTYLAMHAGIALSPGILQGMRKRSGRSKPIAMIPNGCDTQLFSPSTDVQPADNTLPGGFPRDGLRCIFTGAHGIANGLDAVLDAAKQLLQMGRRDIHFVFVGDGRLKPQLIERSKQEKLSNCHFFDPMPKTQLSQVMNESDVGLMILANVPAFYYGTSPNKFFDYIASGIPVVTNYPGWLAEIIQENNCGTAVAPNDPKAFADALIRLADNNESLKQIGHNGRQLALRRFNRQMLGDQFAVFLEEVAGAPASSKVRSPSSTQSSEFSYPVLTSDSDNRRAYLLLKRMVDVMSSVIGLILLSPVFLVIALVIRFGIGSPVIFCQKRPGLGGKPFMLYKFRTMRNSYDDKGNLLPDEMRLTKLGRFIRSTSLDELPSLFNVLRGDMSLVGPRPLLMQYLDRYTPEQARRHLAKPGITGWAQIHGRNAITWEKKFALDV